MNRNRIKHIELLFDIIKVRFDLSPTTILPTDFYEARWIIGEQLEEDWLTHCDFKSSMEISHEKRFAIIDYQASIYFVATGFEDPDNLPIGINFFPLNSGLFTAIITELELPVNSDITNLKVEQQILSQSKADPLYIGHEMRELLPFFPHIFVGELTNQYFGDPNNLSQLICSYLSINKKFISLPLSSKTLTELNNLILLNSKILSYDSIVQSLLSAHFKFSFLDMYRCIEMLYQIVYIDDTYQNLSLTINRTDFLLAIDDKLKWRPNERNSLLKIFKETPDIYKVELYKAIRLIERQINNHSDWLYDLRCSIVHLKSTQRNYIIKHSDWDNLILGLCRMCSYWYQRYQTFD